MRKLAVTLGLLVLTSSAWAAERYTVTESVLLDASADEVWDIVKDFGALDKWHPAVTKTNLVVGEATLRGAERVLTIGNYEGMVRETLTAYSDEDRSFSYVINLTDALPVKDYASTVSVVEVGDDLSLVIWTGEFGRTPDNNKRGGVYSLGRGHNNRAMTMLLAGGGVKPGYVHGETDDFGFNVINDGVHVHDLNATLIHLLGFDHTRLTYRFQGRDYRLTDVHGNVVHSLIA